MVTLVWNSSSSRGRLAPSSVVGAYQLTSPSWHVVTSTSVKLRTAGNQYSVIHKNTVVWDIPGDEREQAEGEADDPVARLEAVEADCPEHEVAEAGQDPLADADHAELRAQRVLRRPIRGDQRSTNHSSPGTGTSR